LSLFPFEYVDRKVGQMDFEYITIENVGSSPSGKTEVFWVRAKSNGAQLGTVKWHGPWRQYAFFPQPDTLYSAGCLNDVSSFIEDEMKTAALTREARHAMRK
jgi:hypothetical protein